MKILPNSVQAGWHNEKRESYGHSVIISPWGEIKAELGAAKKEPEIAVAEIDLEQVERLRNEFPMLRRTYVFGLGTTRSALTL